MSPRPRSIVLWASLMLTALTAACGDTTEPLPKCYLDQTGLVDTGCDPNAVKQGPEAVTDAQPATASR